MIVMIMIMISITILQLQYYCPNVVSRFSAVAASICEWIHALVATAKVGMSSMLFVILVLV